MTCTVAVELVVAFQVFLAAADVVTVEVAGAVDVRDGEVAWKRTEMMMMEQDDSAGQKTEWESELQG